MAYDASSRKDVRRAEKESRLADRVRSDIIRGLMSQPLGRAYVYERLAASHIFHTSFNPDALRMAFAEGERNIGLQLLTDLLAFCPNQFTLMLQERNAEDARRNADDDRSGRGNEDANGRDSVAEDEIGAFDDLYAEPIDHSAN